MKIRKLIAQSKTSALKYYNRKRIKINIKY